MVEKHSDENKLKPLFQTPTNKETKTICPPYVITGIKEILQ